MQNIIEFKNVTFKYDDNSPLLENLSFNIKKGTYSVLLGHNGSGKSTIAKLIIGLLPLKNGQIFVNDLQLNEENIDKIRNNVAIVFQNPDNQFIGSTVEDDIAFGLENRCVEQEKMPEIITKFATLVSMENFLKAEPSALSGGQKQRVAIAGALALNPDLLILDEATSMLDPKGKKEINEVISILRKNNPNMSILSITHHMDEAIIADEILVLNKGQIVKVGTPKDILFDQKLLEENNLLPPFVVNVRKQMLDFSIEELVDKL